MTGWQYYIWKCNMLPLFWQLFSSFPLSNHNQPLSLPWVSGREWAFPTPLLARLCLSACQSLSPLPLPVIELKLEISAPTFQLFLHLIWDAFVKHYTTQVQFCLTVCNSGSLPGRWKKFVLLKKEHPICGPFHCIDAVWSSCLRCHKSPLTLYLANSSERLLWSFLFKELRHRLQPLTRSWILVQTLHSFPDALWCLFSRLAAVSYYG